VAVFPPGLLISLQSHGITPETPTCCGTKIPTTSRVYGAPQIEAKRELQRRLVEFVKQRAELEGWKPDVDLGADCPTITNSVQ